jgi:hypothetical protein
MSQAVYKHIKNEGSVYWYFKYNGFRKDEVLKNKINFVEGIRKMLIKLFNYRMPITTQQFFKYDFAQSKMTLCADLITLVKNQYV